MSDIDTDAQDRAETLDETNLTENGEDIANFDEIDDVLDLTTADGDADEDEFDDEAVDEDDLEDDEGDYRLVADQDLDLDDLADDLEADSDDSSARVGTVDPADGFPAPGDGAVDDALDEALEETFPASDPVSISPSE
jgi:hypothetical protein